MAKMKSSTHDFIIIIIIIIIIIMIITFQGQSSSL